MKRESANPMSGMTTSEIISYLLICRLYEDLDNPNNNKEFDTALHDAIRSLNVLKSFY